MGIARVVSGNRRFLVALATLIATTLVLAACGSSRQSATAPGKATDTVTYAESSGASPNFIWPFMPANYLSSYNITLQRMMYRPLYFFGETGEVSLNEADSMAQVPSYSSDGKTVTITLKSYKWSNGESLTADDVLFWINMDKAERTQWGEYTPGFFPDNIVSASAPNPSTVVLHTDKPYNHNWFLYNELLQITPMPKAWDITGPGHQSDCAINQADCAAVWSYLTSQAKQEATFASNPLWSVVDGPWKLKSFSSDGHISLIPNRAFSGPVKPQLKQVNLAPFTSDAAEFNVLRSGKTLDVGYIPTQDITQPKPKGSPPGGAGPNPLRGYTLLPWPDYGFTYFLPNYTNTVDGALFYKLYFRQALESTVNQPALLTAAAKNYGLPEYGPVPTFPTSSVAPLSPAEMHNSYPFSIANARKYLSDNGWKVVAGGTSTCARAGTGPGECGAGVKAGEKLSFSLIYSSGSESMTTTLESVKSNASRAGIQIALRPEAFDQVIQVALPCTGSGPTCTWQFAQWGGWGYGVDIFPTGEFLFQTGGLNGGGYSDPKMDRLIKQSITSNSPSAFTDYEQYAAKDLPVFYLPNYTTQLTEVASGLKGVPKNNPLGNFDPEYWHY